MGHVYIGFFKRMAALATCAGRYWFSDSASTTGAALAFYCAFSLAPLLIILITLSGWFVGTGAAYEDIRAQLTSLFGPSTARILVDAAKASQQGEGLAVKGDGSGCNGLRHLGLPFSRNVSGTAARSDRSRTPPRPR